MFAPVGLLREIACPYYQDNKCSRPHCILSHGTVNLRNAPSPVVPSAYDYPLRATEEYDPAANYDMGSLRQGSATSYNPGPERGSVRENVIVPVAVSRPGAPLMSTTAKKNTFSNASSVFESEIKQSSASSKAASVDLGKSSSRAPVARNEKHSLAVTELARDVSDAKKKTEISSVSSANKSSAAEAKKKVTAPSTSKGSGVEQLSATQIFNKIDLLPKKISPVIDDDDFLADVNKQKKPRKSAPDSVIDLTDDVDIEPVVKKPNNFPTSSLVEAAALRCKRKLLSPADACLARIRECEKAGAQRAATSSTQPFHAHTSAEGARVAHAPRVNTAAVKGKPRIPIEFNAKVPTSIRQQFLDKLVDELLQTGKEHEWCFAEAVHRENEAYGRSSNVKVYRQVIPNVMLSVRREFGSTSKTTPPKKPAAVSHAAMLMPAGAHMVGVAKQTSPLKNPVTGASSLTKSQLYRLLSKYVLTEEQQKSNGYPVFVANAAGSPTVSIKPPDKRVTQRQSSLSNAQLEAGERECVRCQKIYRINPTTGAFVKREECQYHPGRIQKIRTHARNVEQVYSCCKVSTSSTVGCKLGATHVHEHNRTTDLVGFMSTKDDSNTPGIFALDCEMVYTLKGVELARVTVIDHTLKPVFDALVRPEMDVLDYNTEFSGLKKCDFDNVTERLADIQSKMCSMINARSIIVGHSLESDLIALKIIHRNVVDTAIVYPHPQGPPFKRALRTLVSELLQKAIQQDIEGHDSFEDAASAMELMLFKAKSDYQTATSTSASAVADRSSAHRRNSLPSSTK